MTTTKNEAKQLARLITAMNAAELAGDYDGLEDLGNEVTALYGPAWEPVYSGADGSIVAIELEARA